MPVTLETRVEGIEQVIRRIDTLAGAAEDLSSVWPAVGRWYGARARAVFVAGQSKWAPLKASYMARKPGRTGKGIGVLSGSMRSHATEDTPDLTTKTYALFGLTRKDPATVLRRGQYLKKGRKSMRARNVVPALTAAERRQVAQIMHDHLVEAAAP